MNLPKVIQLGSVDLHPGHSYAEMQQCGCES